jgi:ATP-dependent Lon protease
VIPKANEPDLEDLTEEVRSNLEVHPVETLGEALAVTLRDTSLEEGRLLFGTNRDQPGTRPQ